MTSNVKIILDLVPLGGSIKVDCCVDEISDAIKKAIQTQQNWQEKKYNVDFLKWVATLVENVFKDAKELRADKKEILIKVFEKVFGALNEGDKRILIANLENLHLSKQIQKISKNYLKRTIKKLVFGKK